MDTPSAKKPRSGGAVAPESSTRSTPSVRLLRRCAELHEFSYFAAPSHPFSRLPAFLLLLPTELSSFPGCGALNPSSEQHGGAAGCNRTPDMPP